jgi:hypothetical protein
MQSSPLRNILHKINRRQANCIRHILCRKCLLEYVIEGKIEVTGRRRRRRKQLPDGLKVNEKELENERRGTSSHRLKEADTGARSY